MSDFATFTLCGTVVMEPQALGNFANGRAYDASRFAVKVCKPARDGGGQATAETVEIDAWGSVQQQLHGAYVGCAVLVHGALCARTSQQGRTFLSLRASAVRVLGGSGMVSRPDSADNRQAYERQQASCGQMGQRSGEVDRLADNDIPF